MSSQRGFPFLGGFFGAFKTPRAIQTTSKAASTVTSTSTSTSPSQTHSSPSQPRSITTTTTSKGSTSSALSALHSPRAQGASPLSRSPGPDSQTTASRYVAGKTNRRGSDSSSEGFRDVLGQEKWYVGGKTASGEERYFKLGVVRRQRSGDRLSLDQLSL
ncbi:hypothetical protein HYFRA_00002448 [Hymenoscyphus fraxineus]|uniref:Uncharacterized protein n=1 Tax=Hymenoscyphus fraxineus TaxID=746836 RepID=A0A9N9L6A4_9HELO|nr:hypothetical protein HYFRA_00002448 [Hymenoscyphus fraxineus]